MDAEAATDPLRLALAPLIDAAAEARWVRLVARPGWSAIDRADRDHQPLEVTWSAEHHASALAAYTGPRILQGGICVDLLGDTWVLQAPCDSSWRADDLAREGWLSSLCGRFLSATLAVGRNILCTGPWATAVQLMTTLVAEGSRPALLGQGALPRRFVRLPEGAQASRLGADRVMAGNLRPQHVVQALEEHCGIAAYLGGQRLDRALMRFEIAAEAVAVRGSTPLHVLAGLDLVVVVGQHAGPRVMQVAEIVLTEQGYRPALLFAAGLSPAPAALTPLGPPSFLGELAQGGHTLLAEELAALGDSKGHRERSEAPSHDGPGPTPPLSTAARRPMAREDAGGPRPPFGRDAAAAAVDSDSQPGWELDRLDDEAALGGGATQSEEDATLAATYGLAPPPRPAGYRGDPASTSDFTQAMNDAGATDLAAPESEEDDVP